MAEFTSQAFSTINLLSSLKINGKVSTPQRTFSFSDKDSLKEELLNWNERINTISSSLEDGLNLKQLNSLAENCSIYIENIRLLINKEVAKDRQIGKLIEDTIELAELFQDKVETTIAEKLMGGGDQLLLAGKNLSDYAYFPIIRPELQKYADEQESVHWTADEIHYDGDREDWDKLSVTDPAGKRFIKFILFFFAQGDGIVIENLIDNFKRETSHYKEAGHVYTIFANIELTHAKVYSLFIDTLIRDEKEKLRGYNAISYYPSIRKIAAWVTQWMNPELPLMERVIAFACFEGIIFSSAFAGIYWIKKRNILYGICKANEWIARDERIHTEFAVALYHYATTTDPNEETRQPKVSEQRIHEIIDSCVRVSDNFIRTALLVDQIGLSSGDMVDYVKCCADRLSTSLDCKAIYKVDNPFEWMKIIGLPNKSNFFETQATEYKKMDGGYDFDLDVDF